MTKTNWPSVEGSSTQRPLLESMQRYLKGKGISAEDVAKEPENWLKKIFLDYSRAVPDDIQGLQEIYNYGNNRLNAIPYFAGVMRHYFPEKDYPEDDLALDEDNPWNIDVYSINDLTDNDISPEDWSEMQHDLSREIVRQMDIAKKHQDNIIKGVSDPWS